MHSFTRIAGEGCPRVRLLKASSFERQRPRCLTGAAVESRPTVNPTSVDCQRREEFGFDTFRGTLGSRSRRRRLDGRKIVVRAVWSDGKVTDATPWALYEVRDEQIAEVNESGHIEAVRSGRTAITVTFMGQVNAVTVTVPFQTQAVAEKFETRTFIDRLVAAEWKKVGLSPTAQADAATFLRRALIDITGSMPTTEAIRSFLKSTDTNTRDKAIDSLLERPEYVDCWSTKWVDLLRVHRRYLGDKGMWSFWGWVRNAVRENRPIDQMAQQLITSKGSLFANGATAFYYVDKRPEELAETTSQVLLGIRLQCARCHHHPYEVWSQEDYYGLANFFTRIQIKDNGDGARYGGTKLLRPVPNIPKERRLRIRSQALVRAFGHDADPTTSNDVRVELAQWITKSDNPWFARNVVNRYWAHFMGRGLVEPVDDLRATNPASHPELLTALADDFVKSGYDVKHLIRQICRSNTYQLDAEVAPKHDVDGMFYTHHKFRRLPAAVLLDAVNQACETKEEFDGRPTDTRAQSLPDPQIPSYFLTTFGRSVRNSPCECASSNAPDLTQALHLINSEEIQSKVAAKKGRVTRLTSSKLSTEEIIEELYLATFGRLPSKAESRTASQLITESEPWQLGIEDFMWSLLNSTSFVFNH
ncbi:MAG: hypothetical protein CMJ78_14980 [Planctomycetaceae bacterium]|nr:hypothetical protein [Planctomycetaceae bacterium]